MSRLDRYIIGHIVGLTAIVGLALLAIHAFLTFVAEIDEIGQGFGYRQLLAYTLWLMPSGLYMMLPIIALLGTLMGLGTLAQQSELTAMRAAGVSLMRLGGATLWAGLLLGIACLLLGEWLAPAGRQAAEALKTEARSGVRAGLGGRPVWLREGPHIFHIRQLFAEDHIGAVEIFTLGPDLSLQAATRVNEARYVDGRWRLRGVRSTEFGPEAARVVASATRDWEGSLAPEVLRLFVLEARALSMPGLARLIGYLRSNQLDARDYELTLARKVAAPFTVLAMMLFAIPFVLGPLRNSGTGQRLFVGVLVGLVFYVINEVTANTGQLYRWDPLVSAGAPTALFAAIALWRLHAAR